MNIRTPVKLKNHQFRHNVMRKESSHYSIYNELAFGDDAEDDYEAEDEEYEDMEEASALEFTDL